MCATYKRKSSVVVGLICSCRKRERRLWRKPTVAQSSSAVWEGSSSSVGSSSSSPIFLFFSSSRLATQGISASLSPQNRSPPPRGASILRRHRRSRKSEREAMADHEQPINDTVDEDEYESIIAKRRQEFGDFIEDDDGLGYRDDGEEEDWTRRGLPTSSDESYGGDARPRRRKKVEKKEKEPKVKKPNSSLTAAAMMGKQRLYVDVYVVGV